ncbi:MAG: small multi-drug export protein [Candidatus Thermoplasmatota archaeon]|nr:small multi-drug export protein [Candidatus Thermoplasmatota archaeon]
MKDEGCEDPLDIKGLPMAMLFFFLPIWISTIFVFFLYFTYPWEIFAIVGGGMLLYFIPPAGKETIIPAMLWMLMDTGFSPLSAIITSASIIAYVDVMTAFFLMFNFDLILKIPGLGHIIRKMNTKGHAYLEKKPRIRKVAFVGVATFVIVPFQGSGGVGGTIMGRLIGMKKERVWYAVSFGAIVGCLIVSILTYLFREAFLEIMGSPLFQLVGASILILVIFLAFYSFWLKKWLANRKGLNGDESGDQKNGK